MSTGFLEVRKTRNFWISYFLNSAFRWPGWPVALEKLKSSQRHKSTSSAGAWGLATSSFASSCRFRWFPLLRFPVFETCVLRTHHAWWWTHDISGKRSPKNRSTSYRLIPERWVAYLGYTRRKVWSEGTEATTVDCYVDLAYQITCTDHTVRFRQKPNVLLSLLWLPLFKDSRPTRQWGLQIAGPLTVLRNCSGIGEPPSKGCTKPKIFSWVRERLYLGCMRAVLVQPAIRNGRSEARPSHDSALAKQCANRKDTKLSNHQTIIMDTIFYNITIWSSTLLTLKRHIYSVFTPGIPYPTYPFFSNWLHAGENVAIQCVPYLQVAHLSPLRKQITNKMKTSSKETLGDIKFLWSRDRVTGSPCLHCLRVSLPELHLSQRKLFRWWHTPRKLSTSILRHVK